MTIGYGSRGSVFNDGGSQLPWEDHRPVYEIEAKARVHNATGTLRRLESAGLRFSGPHRQTDTIFAVNADAILHPISGVSVLRLRQDGRRTTLNLKQHRANELDVFEYETDVSDTAAATHILLALGYSVVAKVSKDRYVCQDGRRTVCVDRVDGLGDYVEIEALYDSQPPAGAQEALTDHLHRLLEGDLLESVSQGYDRLMLRREEVSR